jgi:hypothetical protein
LDDLAKQKEAIWTQIREDSMKKGEKKWSDEVRIIWKKYIEELK